jgi:hypothetical protein
MLLPDHPEKQNMATNQIRNEYHFAHNRALLAICVLVTGSLHVTHYMLSLPGAHELIERASLSFFELEQTVEDSIVSGGRLANPKNHELSGGLTSKFDSSSFSMDESSQSLAGVRSSLLELPGIIINALNTLQMEKQNVQRLKELQQLEREREKEREAERVRDRARSSGRPQSSTSPMIGNRESFVDKRKQSQSATILRVKDLSSTRRSSTSHRGQRLSPIEFSTQSLPRASPARAEKHSENVHLSHSHEREFSSPTYAVQTEKASLYLQNKTVDMLRVKSPPSSLQFKAAQSIQRDRVAPLHSQKSQDSIMNISLRAIDKHADQSILHVIEVPSERDADSQNEKQEALFLNPSLFQSTTYSSLPQSKGVDEQPEETVVIPLKSSMISPNAHGLSSYRDFFSVVPSSPHLPSRIKAEDAIIVGEDMTRIRNKFRALAQSAVDRTKNDGDGVMINGKSTVSIQERARKVYAPKRTHYPWEPAPKADTKKGSETDKTIEKESMAVEQLALLDELFDSVDNSSNDKQAKDSQSNYSSIEVEQDDDPTPAWQNSDQRYNPKQYGLKLDNVDFEEQNLFDNFKSIFDYAEVAPPNINNKNIDLDRDDDQSYNPASNNMVRFAREVQQSNDMILG